MKKFMRNILSIVVSAALLVSSTIPVLADGHGHDGGTEITETPPAPTYTIKLTTPKGTKQEGTEYVYGAYQIFSGTVPTNPESVDGSEYKKDEGGYQNPGNELAALPITDIKWGNAFGDVDSSEWQDSIVDFVRALAAAPTGAYSYAFHDFKGFESFVDTENSNYLATRFYNDTNGNDNIDSEEKTNKNVNFDKLAVEVADVLADPDHQNHEWLQAFTDILGGYAQGSGGMYQNQGYVKKYYKSEAGVTTGSDEDAVTTYKITVPAGYYMIRDLSSIGENESYSARMLFVASNVTQVLKESVPQLEKQIVRDDADYETEAAGVGDVVTYKLTGTLPSNYDEYLGGYQYRFTDELSDGLTLNELKNPAGTSSEPKAYVTVTVKGLFKWNDTGAGSWEWVDNAVATIPIQYNETIEAQETHTNEKHLGSKTGEVAFNYQEIYTAPTSDAHAKLEVYFPCLKEIRITGNGEDGTEKDKIYRLGYEGEDETVGDSTTFKSSRIYVTYSATVNEKAVVTNGNENTATLEYSDNPQSYGDTNTTTVDIATVYTFGLEITKVNASEFIKADGDIKKADGTVNTDVVLKNVEFVLIRPNPDTLASGKYQIAKFTDVNETGATIDPFGGAAYRSIDEWENLTATDEASLVAEVKGKLYDTATSGYIHGSNVYILTSDSNGNIRISGLNDGITYTMVETKAPDKYATIDPFTFSLTAAKVGGEGADKDEYTRQLESVTVTNGIGDKDPVDLEHYVDVTNEGFTSAAVSSSSDPAQIKYTAGKVENKGIIDMLVDNFKYEDLPSTGGMGTYLYYIIGGGVILLAAVLFFLSRKKPAKTVK